MAIKLKINKLITDKDLKLYTQSEYKEIHQLTLDFKVHYENTKSIFERNDLDYNYFENRAEEAIKGNRKNILNVLDDDVKKNIFKTECLFNNSEKFITTINNYKIPKERIDNFLDVIQSIKLIKQLGGKIKIKCNENLYDDVILLCKHYNITNANLIINKLFLLRYFENEYFNKIEEKPYLKIKK